MSRLELQSTTTALWHKLVCDAQASMDLKLEQELESYLVFLLMRFTDKPAMHSNALAIEYLNSQRACGNTRHDLLRDVGDKCLLFSGLFPKIAERRHVQLTYYIDLGRGAYLNLSDSLRDNVADMYARLSQSFISLMDVLQVIRSSGAQGFQPGLLDTYDLWQNRDSQSARDTLSNHIGSLPARINNNRH